MSWRVQSTGVETSPRKTLMDIQDSSFDHATPFAFAHAAIFCFRPNTDGFFAY